MAKNEIVVLGLLTISPLHAYAINSILENMGVEHWAQISRASIYSTINRLEKQKAISVKLEKVDNMPERKVFSITEEGRLIFYNELKSAITGSSSNGYDTTCFYLAMNLFWNVSNEEGITWANIRISNFKEHKEVHLVDDLCNFNESNSLPAAISIKSAISCIENEIVVTEEFKNILINKPDYYKNYLKNFRESIETKSK